MMATCISVARRDPRDATHLLEASHALMQSLFPEEANNYLSIEDLCQPDVYFFGATRDDELVGCGALALRSGYGEIKSMFVDPEARGAGIAGAILSHLENEAQTLGLPLLRLETGTLLRSAHQLYARHGFETCDPFGDYDAGPYNVFMEKRLG